MPQTGAARSAGETDRDAELFARMDALARREAEADGLDEDDVALRMDETPQSGAGASSGGAMETQAQADPGFLVAPQQAAPGGPVRAQARSAPPPAPPAAAKPEPPAAATPGPPAAANPGPLKPKPNPGLRRGFLGARPARSAAPPAQPGGAAAPAREQSRTAAEQGSSPEPKPGGGSAEAGALPGARPGAVVERTPAALMRAATSEGDRHGPGPGHAPGPAVQGRRVAAGALQHPEPTPRAPQGVLKQAGKGGAADDAPAARPVSRFKQLRQARGGI